jgi:hypothetical protein
MNLNSSSNNCLYRELQCEGKETQIYIYLCDMISVSSKVCSVQGIEDVTSGRNFCFYFRRVVVIDCFIVCDVVSNT